MKNFVQFVLAILAVVVFVFELPILWAEVALAFFAAIALLDRGWVIIVFGFIIPILAIVIVNYKPDWWLVYLALSDFLAIWKAIEIVSKLNEK